jgi:hypothetical protein
MKVSFPNNSFVKIPTKNIKPISAINSSKEHCFTISTNPIKSQVSFTTASSLLGLAMVNSAKEKKEISDEHFNNLLKRNNIKKIDNDNYVKDYNNDETNEILNSQDWQKSSKNLLFTKISKDEITEFKNFLNLSNGKAIKFIDNNFDNLLVAFLNLKRSNLFEKHKELVNKNEGYQDIVINSAIIPMSTKENKALIDYKDEIYRYINNYLRNGSLHFLYDVKGKSDLIKNCLDKHIVETPINVFRCESSRILEKVKKGEDIVNLRATLIKIQDMNDSKERKEAIKELQEFILDNEIKAQSPCFMSTSLNSDIKNLFGGKNRIMWELEIPKGTKGIYLEPINNNHNLSRENEFLLQKDSSIVLKFIDFDEERKEWNIKGKVLN